MAKINSLISKLPSIGESRMMATGYCVWVAWKGALNPAVHQTLSDYGAVLLAEERHQSLWFFFSTDAFLALARLEIWARLNPLPVFTQLFPAKMLFGFKLEMTISYEAGLDSQEALIPQELEIWVHPKATEAAKGMPGLTFEKAPAMRGLTGLEWSHLTADPRLPYQTSRGWYAALKPLGNPLDKGFQASWKEFNGEIESILERMKVRYLTHDFFVMISLENLRQLRAFCREFLQLIKRVKEDEPERYWPTVLAISSSKGLNFNNELPKKMPIDWDQLMPDFPHMSYRTAFLLGGGFKINDVRFSVDQASVEDWCNVSLTGAEQETLGSLPIETSKRLVAGNFPACFYCGLRNHAVTECPSRSLEGLNPDVWEHMAVLDFDGFNKGFAELDQRMNTEEPVETLGQLLRGQDLPARMVQAMYEISAPFQFRFMRTVWRSRGKDYPGGLSQLGPMEDSNLPAAFTSLLEGEIVHADRLIGQVILRTPRSYQARTLQGFTSVEKGDLQRAATLWKEAEGLSTTPLQQAYHVMLQGRVMEVEGMYQQAATFYKHVLNLAARWDDALYRQGVGMVKMGFAEQAMPHFNAAIERDPHMFNRMLIDPELERGHVQLLGTLYPLWVKAEERIENERKNLDVLRKEIGRWFADDHDFAQKAAQRITELAALGDTKNFVPIQRMVRGRVHLAEDVQTTVDQESKELKTEFQIFMERLKYIRNEAAWFPFPRILVEFNRDFNYCAKNLNWGMRQHFQVPETFRSALEIRDKVESTVKRLESMLRTLKIVRDSTLFLLIMGKTFFWLELVGLIVILVAMPLTIYYGQRMDYDWASGLVARQRWEIQKGLVIVLSIAALAAAAFRSALVFDKKKRKLFEEHGIRE